jgi:ubiquinone biosynthesis protein COQ9
MTDPQSDNVLRLTDAMLAHVAEQDWHGLTLEDVAARAGLTSAQAYGVCPDRIQLLDLFARRMDLASVTGLDTDTDTDTGPAPDDPEARYDQLLDILMMRFEALQPHRESVSKILRDAGREPATLIGVLPQSQRSFMFLAGKAGYPHDGLRGRLLAKALSAVWVLTQRVWLRDESEGLSETMHALDRNLRRALETLEPVLGPGYRPVGDGAGDGSGG